ncbi:hypothetical protein [uncultured Microbacterium sp.]|uniref:hypothetical protein n=1 Tax=uncultured Microbacterium sp. TaxID=191216 RepID=UPI00262C0F48|nr:hypothetical protein [uncultured Microbacterium sp.]
MTRHVRPTRRALTDLGLDFPQLDVELHAIGDALVQKAQRVPAEVASGGAERVRALHDRVWFKVKVTALRGIAGEVPIPDDFAPRTDADYSRSAWWLAAAGSRQDDTTAHDFYATLTDECRRAAKGSDAAVSSAHLLPTATDYRRWQLENSAVIATALRKKVREAIARSAQTGALWIARSALSVSERSFTNVTASRIWPSPRKGSGIIG